LFQNVLLVIIAFLLLVLVIQNGMSKASYSGSSYNMSYPSPHSGDSSAPRNPTVDPSAPAMAQEMVFQAMKAFPEGCEGLSLLAECNSPAAQAVKAEIEQF